MNRLGPPYTDIRVEVFDVSVYDLRQLAGLASITFNPPASGPEVELTFGTSPGAEPVEEGWLVEEVEKYTGRKVLASRRRMKNAATVAPVGNCARCGLDHEGVAFEELDHPIREGQPDALTHWAPCPTNGQPIMLRFSANKVFACAR